MEGEGGCCDPNSYFETKSGHFEKYMHAMELKLTGHAGITISLHYMQKIR